MDNPKYFNENEIFLDTKKILETLKLEYLRQGFQPREVPKPSSRSREGIAAEARDVILLQKSADL